MNKLIDSSAEKKLAQLKQLGTVLSHPLRIKMLNFINKQSECCVEDIELQLNIKQAIASQQLKILRSLGFIKNRRDGKRILYSINNDDNQIQINVIIDIVNQIYQEIHPIKKC